MKSQERSAATAGLHGCLASVAAASLVMILLSAILTRWLGVTNAASERTAALVVWLIAVFSGGYLAAKMKSSDGLNNAVYTGLLAELFVLMKLNAKIPEVLLDPTTPAAALTLGYLLLTAPLALLGGWLAGINRGSNPVNPSSPQGPRGDVE